MKRKEEISKNIVEGADEDFGYSHFSSSNMADYTLMSHTIRDMVAVYDIADHDAVDIIQGLTH